MMNVTVLRKVEDENRCRLVEPCWTQDCFRQLHRFYGTRELCDVTLVAGGQEFPCHRVILASASKYFYAMLAGGFVEKNRSRIELNEVNSDCLKIVLEFIYTGSIIVTTETVQDVFVAAHMLQVDKLEEACVDYMQRLITDTNCIGFYFFAKIYDRTHLMERSQNIIQTKFDVVVSGDEFLQLPVSEAAEILNAREVFCKNAMEETVCNAALAWLSYDWPARRKHVYDVIRVIRLVYLSDDYYRKLKVNPMLRGSPRVQHLFEQVDYLLKHRNRWHEVDLLLEVRVWRSLNQEHMVVYAGRDKDAKESKETWGSFRCKPVFTEISAWPNGIHHPRLAVHATKSCHELYVANGDGKGSPRMFKFTVESSFVEVAPIKQKRSHFSLVSCDKHVYALGGSRRGVLQQTVEQYDPEHNKWIKAAPLPARLRGTCAISFQGKIYVFGGEISSRTVAKKDVSNKVFCFDPIKGKWHSCRPMPTPRSWANGAIYSNKIYVVGGLQRLADKSMMDNSHEKIEGATVCVEVYNPQTDTWKEGPALPKPLAAPGVVKFLGTICAMGGVNHEGSNYTAYTLNDDGMGWSTSSQELMDYCQPTLYSTFTPILFWDMDLLGLSDTESDSDSDSLASYDPSEVRMRRRSVRRRGGYPPIPAIPMEDSLGSVDSDSSLEAVGMQHQYMENDSDSWSSDEW